MKRVTSFVLTSIAAATLAGALAGCAPLIIGGAAAGAALVVTDRRTSGAQLEDEGIELRGGARLREAFGDHAHININSYNRMVLLTGEVPDEAARQRAEQVIGRVENVRSIVNELAVLGNSSLTQRSNDVLISAKVKASLVDAKELQANAFRVVVERGTVYLMGRVTAAEADRATQITRTVGGVQRVVRVFETITPEELKALQPSK